MWIDVCIDITYIHNARTCVCVSVGLHENLPQEVVENIFCVCLCQSEHFCLLSSVRNSVQIFLYKLYQLLHAVLNRLLDNSCLIGEDFRV